MAEQEKEADHKQTPLAIFKALSTFISSVIIALTGLVVSYQYNSRQLEVAQSQAEAQIQISRNKELSVLIPNLGAADANLRKFSAISLSLYGEHVVPVLVYAMGDENQDVRIAAIEAIRMIGDAAIPELERTYADRRNTRNQRAGALYALGKMKAPSAYTLAAAALDNPNEDPVVRSDAATVLAFVKEKRAIDKLLAVLEISQTRDSELTANIIYALGEMGDGTLAQYLQKLLYHPSETVRYQVVWALGKVGDDSVINVLAQIEQRDSSTKVRQAARDAQVWLRRKF